MSCTAPYSRPSSFSSPRSEPESSPVSMRRCEISWPPCALSAPGARLIRAGMPGCGRSIHAPFTEDCPVAGSTSVLGSSAKRKMAETGAFASCRMAHSLGMTSPFSLRSGLMSFPMKASRTKSRWRPASPLKSSGSSVSCLACFAWRSRYRSVPRSVRNRSPPMLPRAFPA